MLTQEEIEANLKRYVNDRRDTARYASFDYCFNYFRSFHESRRLADLLSADYLQVSCLHLGFYLASWGMFRGKSHLLQGSMKHYVPLLEVIAASGELFDFDVPDYGGAVMESIRRGFARVREAFPHPATETLVTKVMLGVFDCVPAFDTYFKSGFDVWSFGPKSLRRIRAFYEANSATIEQYRIPTIDFVSGQNTRFRYTAAKVIDMIFFIEGLKKGLVP